MQVKLQAEVGHEVAEDVGCEFVYIADVLGSPVPNHATYYNQIHKMRCLTGRQCRCITTGVMCEEIGVTTTRRSALLCSFWRRVK